uniref:Uncharacterized protein n=1 Tax=Manihot esculenta TaxID=3983 RepID=A0A251LW74_MANES
MQLKLILKDGRGCRRSDGLITWILLRLAFARTIPLSMVPLVMGMLYSSCYKPPEHGPENKRNNWLHAAAH